MRGAWRRAGAARGLRATVAGLAAALCACGGTGGAECGTDGDCGPGRVCIDGRCVTADGSGMDDAEAADGMDEGAEAVEAPDGSRCPSGILCGTPPACCAAGEECVEGACLPACASGVRCGADLTVCCDPGQVCIGGVCETPGEACIDSFDCGEGRFCEPTLDRCVTQLDPVTCEVRPEPGPFAVVEEWAWRGGGTLPEYDQVVAIPVVVDLEGDGVPEVVVPTARPTSWFDGVLRALRGDSGAEVWTVTDPAYRINTWVGAAAGDIDGDGHPEVVVLGGPAPAPAYAFEHDGSFKWASTGAGGAAASYAGNNKGIAIADLEADGSPEIIAGGIVLGADGRERAVLGRGALEGDNGGWGGGQPTAADLDLDTELEIVTGARAWRADGTPFWDTAPLGDGYPGVADFDLDGAPEVVVVSAGTVRIHDGASGALSWGPASVPGGGIGGPPTIADFDGDGLPEIGVAGAASYSVYDPDGTAPVLWSMPTQDESSNSTGSSVFDFEGDGAAEVVYCDECVARVYRGSTGDTLLEVINSTGTVNEYPLVVDVDGDGNSEIVMVANDWAAGSPPYSCPSTPGFVPRHGVFVYGDEHDRWVGTRRIWNEHSYHVTNVNADGTVPAGEVPNWTTEGLNNFRQNVQGAGVFNAPDLVLLALSVDLGDCPRTATLQARVANAGSLGVEAGIPVAFYEGTVADPDALLGTAATTVPLLPGASTMVTLVVSLGPGPAYSFLAVVDDDGTGAGSVVECREDNNEASIAGVDCLLL